MPVVLHYISFNSHCSLTGSQSVPLMASSQPTDRRISAFVQKLKSCPKSCLLQLHLVGQELPTSSATQLEKLTTSLKRANVTAINLNPRHPSIVRTDRLAELLSYALSLARKFHGGQACGDVYKSVGRVKRLLTIGVRTAGALIKALSDTANSEDAETEVCESHLQNSVPQVVVSQVSHVAEKSVLNFTKKTGQQGLKRPLKSILKKTKNLTGHGISSLVSDLVAPSSKSVMSPEDLAESFDKSFRENKYTIFKSVHSIAEKLSKASMTVSTKVDTSCPRNCKEPTSHKVLTDGSVKFTLFASRLTSILEERKKSGQSLIFLNLSNIGCVKDTADSKKTTSPLKTGRLTALVQNKEAVCLSAKLFADRLRQSIHDQLHKVESMCSTETDRQLHSQVTLDIQGRSLEDSNIPSHSSVDTSCPNNINVVTVY